MTSNHPPLSFFTLFHGSGKNLKARFKVGSMNFLLNKVIFSNRINALDRSVLRVTKMLKLIVFIVLVTLISKNPQ